MMRWIFSSLAVIALGSTASAQSPLCDKSEAACVLDAAWSAALILPAEKQDRLAGAFLEIASATGDTELVQFWEQRFNREAPGDVHVSDYGWRQAEPILAERGVEGLIAEVTRPTSSLAIARADVLLAAGKHFAQIDPAAARKIYDALFGLIGRASSFERPSLAHAAAELAMARCDLEGLEAATALTDAPRNIRYAFWRARISGDGLTLLPRVRGLENDQDTRDVRRVLDGYRAILELGYCNAEKSPIGP